jgi:hypothetical protein
MKDRYLYRGVNSQLHSENGGALLPKRIGMPFTRGVFYGEKIFFGGGAVYGKSERNAVLMHQKDSSEYQTSGVSTTPNYHNAVKYATHNGKYSSGYIYTIETSLLNQYGVKAYIIAEHVKQSAVPGDEEIILVASEASPQTVES